VHLLILMAMQENNLYKIIAQQLHRPSGRFGPFAGFLWNRRNRVLNDTALVRLDLQPGDRVLEIGFGGGYLLSRMAGLLTGGFLAGIDCSPAMLGYCQKRLRRSCRLSNLDLKCARAESLPYPTGYFTKVCSVNSIFYWCPIEQGIVEISRVLVPGGQCVLCFTHRNSLENRKFTQYIQCVNANEIERIGRENGFYKISSTVFRDRYREFICMIMNK
jgi:ubiquinone/menaquinone biosynthesis C-methylase UbiE